MTGSRSDPDKTEEYLSWFCGSCGKSLRSDNRLLEFYAEEGYKLRALRQFLERLDTQGVLQLPVKTLRQFLEDLDTREPIRPREPKLRKEKL